MRSCCNYKLNQTYYTNDEVISSKELSPFQKCMPEFYKDWYTQMLVDLPMNTDINTWSVPLLVDDVPCDYSIHGRVGRKITMFRLEFRGSILLNTVVTPPNTLSAIRVVIFYDRQTNGTAPPFAGGPPCLNGNHSFAFPSIDGASRYIILADETSTSQSSTGCSDISFSRNLDLDVIFNDVQESSITGITTGGIFISFTDLNKASSLGRNQFYGAVRLFYSDI